MMMMMMTTTTTTAMMIIPKIIHQNLKFQDPVLTVLRVTAPLSQNKAHRGGSAV
jgi:hypothetical protein